MANWLIVIDENEERRSRFFASAESKIRPFDDLKVESTGGAGWNIVWAAGTSAPVDAEFGPRGGAVVWGEARDETGALRSASDISKAWQGGAVAQWDGFYSTVVVDEQARSVTAGTDLLGIWPIYYWTNHKGVALVATSPQLFCGHPEFRAEIDLDGLIGILLTNGVLDNQALWKGVRRLFPGNRVRVVNGAVREDVNYRVPTDIETADLPFRGHVRQVDECLRRAMSRHAPPGRQYGLMLSGGLDSRILAGTLADQQADVQCLTLGRKRDFEMQCAKAVARSVGFKHIEAEIPDSEYTDSAARLAHWELLGAGFSGVPEWGMRDILDSMPDRMVVGHCFDGVVGGIHIGWAYDSKTRIMGLDVLMPTILAWGLRPDALKRLVGHEAGGKVDAAMERIRSVYDSLAPREHHRAWLIDLQYRQRLHVGSALWPMSYSAWPVAPFLDRDVLRLCASLPASSIADRRVQFGILTRCFPRLAALPLDRNSWNDMPPRPALRDFIRRSLNYRVHGVQRAARKLLGKDMPDRVYYHRLYDFNSPGWRSVRQMGEPFREGIKMQLDPDVVDAILPPPDRSIEYANRVKDASAARMLLGLGLTARYLGPG